MINQGSMICKCQQKDGTNDLCFTKKNILTYYHPKKKALSLLPSSSQSCAPVTMAVASPLLPLPDTPGEQTSQPSKHLIPHRATIDSHDLVS